MLQLLLLAALSLLVVVACLVGLVWVVLTGSIGGMDGIFLAMVCLLVGLVFSTSLFGVVRHGGLLERLKMRRFKARPAEEPKSDEMEKN